MNNEIEKEMVALSGNVMSEVFESYECMDWGCDWREFLNTFSECMNESIKAWEDAYDDEEGE